uniref:hypothetical protein n=1 Tax=Micromonospora sp. TaxID=1876 RepID=UPI003B3A37D3
SGVRNAYVLMGSLFGSFPVGAHTWVVYGDGTDGRAYLMNPPSLRAQPLTARWVRSVDPVAAWNDQDVAVGRSVLPMLVAELKLEETA